VWATTSGTGAMQREARREEAHMRNIQSRDEAPRAGWEEEEGLEPSLA